MMACFDNLPRKSSYFFEMVRGKLNGFYYKFFYKKLKIGSKLRLGKSCNLAIWGDCQLSIGNNVYIRNFCRIQIENGDLIIGNNTFFNNFCTINCLDKIIIGSDCLFGEAVKIYDHNHKFRNLKQLINKQDYSLGEVKIGNNCWIGSNVVILKGVTSVIM